MEPDRWLFVKQVFHAALERPEPERQAFLAAECRGDAQLRAEVERLLDAAADAGSFIEHSPVAAGSVPAAPLTEPPLVGRTIGRYKVARLIGAGGMGEVYFARDVELGRDVALKLATSGDGDAYVRLRREAQHASQLNHPHICTIYEVSTFDNQPFIVMEYVEGSRLADLIPAAGLPLSQVRRYGAQIASALAHAHSHGVIHGDLKSANVVVTPEDRAKILDFGLARRLSAERLRDMSASQVSISADRAVAGTLACMAPELLRGEKADERSDIWALGVLLHEMVAGARPFSGATGFELSAAILDQPPAALTDKAPESLRTVIRRCLAKDPRDRYQRAVDVQEALEETTITLPPVVAPLRRWSVGIAIAGLLVAIALAVGWRRMAPMAPPAHTALGASGRPAIAVMSFDNAAGGPETAWLSQGVPSMLLTGLAQTHGLEVVSTQRLNEAVRQMGKPDLTAIDRSEIAEVARRAGAGAVVVGSIFIAGAEIRIDARVEDLASGRVLTAERVQGTDVFALADRLASRIRTGVGLAGTAPVRALADVSTSSVEAYRLYSEGVDARSVFRLSEAQTFLERAVAIDPGFAGAYLQLAFVTNDLGFHERRTEYLAKAAEHAVRLSEREHLLLNVETARVSGRPADAARALDELVAQFPDVDVAYEIASQLYLPVLGPLPNAEKLLAMTKAGVSALPLSPLPHNLYAYALLINGRPVDAIREYEVYARLAPREPEPYDGISVTYQVMGLPQRAIDAGAQALKIDPRYAPARENRAWSFAMLGRYEEALAENASVPFPRAYFFSRVGRYRAAEDFVAQVKRAAEGRKDVAIVAWLNFVSSRVAIERGDYARALQECREMEQVSRPLPDEARRFNQVFAGTLCGVAEVRQGRNDLAALHLMSLERAYKPTVPLENWLYHALKGEIALAARDFQKAAAAFEAGEPPTRTANFGAGPGNNPPFRDGSARVAKARGDRFGALEIYRRLLTQAPEQKWLAPFEPLYVLEIARLLEQTHDPRSARKEYERFLGFWKQADAGLPELAEARAAVARLPQ